MGAKGAYYDALGKVLWVKVEQFLPE